MIKLKDIVKEFDVSKTVALSTDTAYDIFERFTGGDERYLRTLVGDWYWESPDDRSAGDYPISKEITNAIKKYKIKSVGGFTICKIGKDLASSWFLIKEGKNQTIDDTFLGVIETMKDFNILQDRYKTPLPGTTFDIPTPEVVHWSSVSEGNLGKGYGKILYDTVLDTIGALASDESLFKGSYNMWVHHMSKKRFFGIIQRGKRDEYAMIIPVSGKAVVQDKLVRSGTNERFVVLSDKVKVPTILRKLQHNMKGIDIYSEMVTINMERLSLSTNIKPKSKAKKADLYPSGTIVSIIEDNMASFDNLMSLLIAFANEQYAPFGQVRGARTFYVAPETQGSVIDMAKKGKLKLIILSLKDAILLVKETGSGLSVTLL